MNISSVPAHPLWGQAFRPMFLLGAAFSALAILLWGLALQGIILLPGSGSVFWHSHEMLFGFALAIVAGFLLTAVQNWTGQRATHGRPLLLLTLLWLAGRPRGPGRARRDRLQHEPVRLSGDPHRPVLRRADRDHDGAADWELRRMPRGRRSIAPVGGWTGRQRAQSQLQQLAGRGLLGRLPQASRYHLHSRRRHAQGYATYPIGGCHARRDRPGGVGPG